MSHCGLTGFDGSASGALRRSISDPAATAFIPLFKGQFKFELKYSMVTVLVFAAGGLNFAFAKQSGAGQLYFSIAERGIPYFIFTVFFMLLLNDVYFYWCHRWLHRRGNFGRFHSVHHRSKVTTPWTSQSFHWFETAINVFIAILFPYLFPLHPAAYVIFSFIAFLNNVYGHGNYDFVPLKWRGQFPFVLLNSPSVHSYHHENVVGNYGLYTNIWDRLHKTYMDPG